MFQMEVIDRSDMMGYVKGKAVPLHRMKAKGGEEV
jgi:hypothetical protein